MLGIFNITRILPIVKTYCSIYKKRYAHRPFFTGKHRTEDGKYSFKFSGKRKLIFKRKRTNLLVWEKSESDK
jgi:hypothetical protein